MKRVELRGTKPLGLRYLQRCRIRERLDVGDSLAFEAELLAAEIQLAGGRNRGFTRLGNPTQRLGSPGLGIVGGIEELFHTGY